MAYASGRIPSAVSSFMGDSVTDGGKYVSVARVVLSRLLLSKKSYSRWSICLKETSADIWVKYGSRWTV